MHNVFHTDCFWCKQIKGNVSFVDHFGDPSGNSFGFVSYDWNERTIYLTFRGTDDIKGFIADLNFFQKSLPVNVFSTKHIITTFFSKKIDKFSFNALLVGK